MSILSEAPPRIHRIDPGHPPDVAPAPHSNPAAEVGRIAEWYAEQLQTLYPDLWAETPKPIRCRVWAILTPTLAEFQEVVGPIFESSPPASELVDRIIDALDDWTKARQERHNAEERERRRIRDQERAEAARQVARRLVAEAARRLDEAMATFRQIEIGEPEVIDLDYDAEREFTIQARHAVKDAERALGRRMIGALNRLAPGMAAYDEGGYPVPFGIASGDSLYLLMGDVRYRETRLIARVSLDRIVGLS